MKKFLLAGIAGVAFLSAPAFAADMPTKAQSYRAVAPMFNWSGCYIGAQAGYAWGRSTSVDTEITPGEVDARAHPDGWLGGGTLGCNYQAASNWVWGVEGDLSWANVSGSSPFIPVPAFTRETSFDWLSTVRGRLGYAVDRSLWYLTGGVAFANIKEREFFGATDVSNTKTKSGWVVGGGVEWALANPQWSIKAEYLYIDFGNSNIADPAITDQKNHLKENVFRVGVNYRFGDIWGKAPVSARY